jgi:hypothetical protein
MPHCGDYGEQDCLFPASGVRPSPAAAMFEMQAIGE